MSALGQSRPCRDDRYWREADIRRSGEVRKVPIVLKKSSWGDDQNFSGPLMPFARGNMRDHIVSRKKRPRTSYRRYAALQCTFASLGFVQTLLFDRLSGRHMSVACECR